MALSGKYGKVDISGIAGDEPVFILRAQDMFAAAAIEMYKILVESHECSLASNLDKEIDAFRMWPGRRKMPD